MTKFQIVTDHASHNQVFETDDPAAAFDVRGFDIDGVQGGKHLRPELQGQPKFRGLCGPMWGGTDDAGQPIIRYEDWGSYEVLSR